METIVMENTEMSPEERQKWKDLADDLENLTGKNAVIGKLADSLRRGFVDAARIYCDTQADKFSEFRKTAVPIIVTRLYDGINSPWPSIEKEIEKGKA